MVIKTVCLMSNNLYWLVDSQYLKLTLCSFQVTDSYYVEEQVTYCQPFCDIMNLIVKCYRLNGMHVYTFRDNKLYAATATVCNCMLTKFQGN